MEEIIFLIMKGFVLNAIRQSIDRSHIACLPLPLPVLQVDFCQTTAIVQLYVSYNLTSFFTMGPSTKSFKKTTNRVCIRTGDSIKEGEHLVCRNSSDVCQGEVISIKIRTRLFLVKIRPQLLSLVAHACHS